MFTKADNARLEEMINGLPENQPLYKDSGVWQIRSDDMNDVLFFQEVNETFTDFIERCYNERPLVV